MSEILSDEEIENALNDVGNRWLNYDYPDTRLEESDELAQRRILASHRAQAAEIARLKRQVEAADKLIDDLGTALDTGRDGDDVATAMKCHSLLVKFYREHWIPPLQRTDQPAQQSAEE